MRIGLSTDNSTPQNEIRYQVLSNGVPIPGALLLADTNVVCTGIASLTVALIAGALPVLRYVIV